MIANNLRDDGLDHKDDFYNIMTNKSEDNVSEPKTEKPPTADDDEEIADEKIPIAVVSTTTNKQTVEADKKNTTYSQEFISSSYSPVKYLTIIISPGIEFLPKMLNKSSSTNAVLFNPIIEYSEFQINKRTAATTTKYDPRDKTEIYDKFFNKQAFNTMLEDSARSPFSQRSLGQAIGENLPSFLSDPKTEAKTKLRMNKTIQQATVEGIVDRNIVATLNTLFTTNNVLYINGNPYTVYSYSWNKEWQIDTKLPKSFEYGMSPYGADNYYRYKTDQMRFADQELAKIPSDAHMSKAMRDRLQKQEESHVVATTNLKTTTTKTYSLIIGANLGNEANVKGLDNLDYLLNFQMNYGCRKTITPARDSVLDPTSFSLILTDEFLSKNKEIKTSYDNSTQKNNDFASAYNNFYQSFSDILKAKQEITTAYDELSNGLNKANPPSVQKGGANPAIYAADSPKPVILGQTQLFYALAKIQNGDPTLNRFGNIFRMETAKTKKIPNAIKNLIDTSRELVQIFNETSLDNEYVLQLEKNQIRQPPSNKEEKRKLELVNQKMSQLFDNDLKKVNVLHKFNQQLDDLKAMEKGDLIMTEINKIQEEHNAGIIEAFNVWSKSTQLIKRNSDAFEKWRDTFIVKIKIIKDNIRTFSNNINKNVADYKKLIDFQIKCFKTFISTLRMLQNYFDKPADKPYRIIIDNDMDLYIKLIKKLNEITDENFTRQLDVLLISINEQHDLLYSNELAALYFNNPLSIKADNASLNNFINEYVRIFMRSNNFILTEMQSASNKIYSEFVAKVRANIESFSPPSVPTNVASALSGIPIAVASVSSTDLVQSAASEKNKMDTYKLIHMIIALTEIMCSRTINSMSQINYFNEVNLSIAKIEIDVFNNFIKGMENSNSSETDTVQCINPKYFNLKRSDLQNLLKMFEESKSVILDKEVSNYSKFNYFKEQCAKVFKQLLPKQKEPVKNMCDLISAGDELKFEVRSLETFMSEKKNIQDIEVQTKFQNKLMQFMSSNQTSYKFNEPNYVKFWKLYKIYPQENPILIILSSVLAILNGQLHLENKITTHEWSDEGIFTFNKNFEGENLYNSLAKTYETNVAGLFNSLKQAFKIKFFMLDLDDAVKIDTNFCNTPNKEENDEIEGGSDVTDFALIVKHDQQYFVPYNLYFNTLLYSVSQLKTLDIDILVQSFCGKTFANKKNTTKTIDNLSTNAKNKMIFQKGGEPKTGITTDLSSDGKREVTTTVTSDVETPSIKNKIAPTMNTTNPTNTTSYGDNQNIKKTYSKDSKLSYYVVIELTLWPGTSINPAQRLKLACQKNADEVRRAWSEWQGLIYVPTPLFVNNSLEDSRGYASDANRALQTKSISTILKENNKYDKLLGDDFVDKMMEKINTTSEFTRAFSVLPIASDEYNNLLKSRKITTEDLNELITEAKYALR